MCECSAASLHLDFSGRAAANLLTHPQALPGVLDAKSVFAFALEPADQHLLLPASAKLPSCLQEFQWDWLR